MCLPALKIFLFAQENGVYTDEMPHNATFHPCIHSLLMVHIGITSIEKDKLV